MPGAPSVLRQVDIERAIRAAKKVGMAVRILRDGTIEIIEQESADHSRKSALAASGGIRL